VEQRKPKLIDDLHNLSLHILTLCGFGALVSLAVNVLTALIMLLQDRRK